MFAGGTNIIISVIILSLYCLLPTRPCDDKHYHKALDKLTTDFYCSVFTYTDQTLHFKIEIKVMKVS